MNARSEFTNLTLVRFAGSKDHLEKMARGMLRCTPIDEYADESQKGEIHFDPDEGISASLANAEVMFRGKKLRPKRVKIRPDSNAHLLCLHSIDDRFVKRAQSLEQLKGQLLPDQRMNSYGNHVLVILNPLEFVERVKKACSLKGIKLKADFVKYRNLNEDSVIIEDEEICFIKDVKHLYEREFRLAFFSHHSPQETFELNVGDLRDVSEICKFEELGELMMVNLK